MSGVAMGRRGSGFAGVREASIGAVVIRADGTVEPRGLVSYYHENILLRLCVGLWIRWRAWRWCRDASGQQSAISNQPWVGC